MNTKYEFTGETMLDYSGKTLHRIRALRCIKTKYGIVKVGDIGGWIEKEYNLSHEDDAWVSGNARVSGDAWVSGNARVSGDARVYGDAWVSGDARVSGDAEIYRKCHILTVGPIGSREAYTTFYRSKRNEIVVKCGCFCGSMTEFLEKVKERHFDSKHGVIYRMAADLAKIQIDLKGE